MTIYLTCQECGKDHEVPDNAAGKTAKCKCGAKMKVPVPYVPGQATQEMAEDWSAYLPSEDELWRFTPVGIALLVAAVVLVSILAYIGSARYEIYSDELNARTLYNEYVAAKEKKDNNEAIRKLTDLAVVRPDWKAIKIERALLAAKIKHENAGDWLQEVLDMGLSDGYKKWALATMIDWQLSAKEPELDKAGDNLLKLLEIDKDNPSALLMLAAIANKQSKKDDFDKYMNMLADKHESLDSKSKELYRRMDFFRAYDEQDEERWNETIKAFGGNIPKDAQQAIPTMRLNFLAARKEIDPEKDKGLLKEAMQAARNIKDEDLKLDYERNFVKLAYKEGRYEEAAGGFQKLLGRNPKPSEATYLLANCYSLIREQTKDEGKKKEYARKALDLYLPITEDKELSEKYGKPLLLNTMGYCDLLGEKEKSEQLLQLGLEKYPDDPSLNRRAGALAFQKKEYKAGLALFEKSLKLNPEQPQLAAAVERYRKKPEATDFRPSKPEDCIARPLIHVSVRSGSPFPLREESVKVTLNGKDVGFARGGNEFFYTPEEDLKAGMHIVMVVAEDTMGNRAEQEFKFPVDHTPPLAELVSPTGLAERDQMFVVKCYDELTSVRIDSIRISIRNAKGNPHFLSKSVIIKGEYKVDDKDLGINRGDPIRDPAKIVFRLDKPLASGNYEMQVVMEDVLGHSGKETFNFRAR